MSASIKVAIIGMGSVGASVAISTLHLGIATEVWVNDLNGERAKGEAMDLAHGAPFYPIARVRVVSLDEMVAADAVVITAGRGGKPGESRLDLLQSNAAIARDIGTRLAGCMGVVLVVSNPVDVLTHVVARASGLPAERVYSVNTSYTCHSRMFPA